MISKRFHDFEAFAAVVRDVDCRMFLNNPQHRLWAVDQVTVDGIDVQFGQLGSGNFLEGQSWPNGYLLYLPLTERCEYLANGSVIEKNAVAIFEPGCEFVLSTKVKHDWCSIFVPTHRITRNNNLLESSVAISAINKPRLRTTRANPHLSKQFWSAVNQVMIAAKNSPQFESSPASESASQNLFNIARSLLGLPWANQPRQQGRPKANRTEIISACRELLEQRADQTVRVEEMAAMAGVSERTLRSAFTEYFGVPPAKYLQLRQLIQVHRTLRRASPAWLSVSDVLVDHGVWEFGRFASRYRNLFGELPSETLRKAKGQHHTTGGILS